MADDVTIYTYGNNVKLSEHFYSDDFKCPYSKTIKISKRLVELLEKFYSRGVTLHLTCAYRSEEYNKILIDQGYMASKTSLHLQGKAADICGYDRDGKMLSLADICCLAQLCGAEGIGIMKTNVHVDVRGYKCYFHENYASGKHESVADVYAFFDTTKEAFAAKYPIVASNLAGVTGKYRLVINSLAAADVSANSVTMSAEVTDKFDNFGWCYSLNGSKDLVPVTVGGSNFTFTIGNLNPNSFYTVALVAKEGYYQYSSVEGGDNTERIPMVIQSNENDFSSNTLKIRTSRRTLQGVKSVSARFSFEDNLLNSECDLSIDKSGSTSADGYRISLIINGIQVAYDDSILASNKTTAKFRLNKFATKGVTLHIDDLIQIGVTPFVGSKTFSPNSTVYSPAVSIQAKAKKVDKIYVKAGDAFKRLVLNRCK